MPKKGKKRSKRRQQSPSTVWTGTGSCYERVIHNNNIYCIPCPKNSPKRRRSPSCMKLAQEYHSQPTIRDEVVFTETVITTYGYNCNNIQPNYNLINFNNLTTNCRHTHIII